MNDEQRKVEQDYDEDTPRCFNCCYFRREPMDSAMSYVDRVNKRGNKIRCKLPPSRRRQVNPIVDKCTFGNFQVKPGALCREWHGRDGAKLVDEIPMRLVSAGK